ncbi:MAG: haloacid dehalogenase [Dehalococcoidales bacterium]
MSKSTENLESFADELRQTFSAKDSAREKALPLCRQAIRYCARAIRSVHRQEFKPAEELLQSAREQLVEAKEALAKHSDLSHTAFLRDAQKEFAEGVITLALVAGRMLPAPDELDIAPAAYLNGMGEAVGELRRYLLDSMRKGDLSRGEELLGAMDDIYSTLVTMDFPDAITGGLRHTTDMVRGVLERTRSDLTLGIRQKELENRLKNLHPVDDKP